MGWYVSTGKQHFGPVTAEKLKQWAAEGRIKHDTLVLKQGLSRWVPAGTIKDLFPTKVEIFREPEVLDEPEVIAEPETIEESLPSEEIDPLAEIAAETSARKHYERLQYASHVKPTTDPTLKMGLGICGAAVLLLGVFAPIVRVPIVGSINYFQNGHGDGVIVLILAVITFVLALTRLFPGLIVTGALTFACIGFTFINFQVKLAEAKEGLQGNPFGGMADAIQIDWGFAVLIIGAGLVVAAGVMPAKEIDRR